MHCEKNFPLRKQQSDLDIGLQCGLNDEQYFNTVKDYLPWILETFKPDLVLYDAGVDPHQDDALGKLNLTDQGIVLFCNRCKFHFTGIFCANLSQNKKDLRLR